MEKLNQQLAEAEAEAEAELEAHKKHPEDTGPGIVGDGLVIDEWVRRHFTVCFHILLDTLLFYVLIWLFWVYCFFL